MSADSANLYNHVYHGIGSGTESSNALPEQYLPSKKKDDKWGEATMDRLEEIGLRQLQANMVFNDLYFMVEGDLAYLDYVDEPETLRHVADIRSKVDIPSYIKHYDIIGRSGHHLAGKYNDTKGKFRVDFMEDSIAQSEYDREISNRLFQYTQQMFALEVQAQMVAAGVEMREDFQTEEERQQYLQYLQQEKNKLNTPPEIKTAVSTKWKPRAAIWAEKTLEKDRIRYNTDENDRLFFMDRYLTGRYFNHYALGYDYYKPERWDPRETFFSEDSTTKYPQDCEYVGNIQDMAPSRIVDNFGHLMTEEQQKGILNHFKYKKGAQGDTFQGIMNESPNVADENYYDRKSTVALQGALGVPFGETTYFGENGEAKSTPSWVRDYNWSNDGFHSISQNLRRDISTRTDTIRVTQAYWRSYERVGLLYYETELGFGATQWVTDEIMDDFLKENNITTTKKIGLTEFENRYRAGTLEPNSIVFMPAPRIYKGVKLSGTNSILKKDIYLGVEPLPFQIKGISNIFDVKIPVGGIITTSIAKKIRPYQTELNVQMNLIRSLTEKELGVFWLFDMNYLPSDFEGLGDSRETLLSIVDMARDIGIVPVDTSKQNMGMQQGSGNAMMPQNISFTAQIQQKMQMAEYYKTLALEQIGITAQDLGTPSEYATAEGIRVGQSNTMSQIEHLFEEQDSARLKDMEINLAIAQYCQANNKDISVTFTQPTEEQFIVREVLADENFHLRKFGLLPIADSKRRKELETFKQYMLSSNTFDLLDVAKTVTSDSFQVVRNQLQESARERQEEVQAQRNHEQQLADKKIQAEQQTKQQETAIAFEKQARELENNIQVETIRATGRLKDNTDGQGDARVMQETADKYLKNEMETRKLDLKEEDQQNKNQIALAQVRRDMEELQIKREANDLKRKAIEAKTFGDVINKN